MFCWGRPYHFKFFKGCLPQILFGSILEYLDPYVRMTQAMLMYTEPIQAVKNHSKLRNQYLKKRSHWSILVYTKHYALQQEKSILWAFRDWIGHQKWIVFEICSSFFPCISKYFRDRLQIFLLILNELSRVN